MQLSKAKRNALNKIVDLCYKYDITPHEIDNALVGEFGIDD